MQVARAGVHIQANYHAYNFELLKKAVNILFPATDSDPAQRNELLHQRGVILKVCTGWCTSPWLKALKRRLNMKWLMMRSSSVWRTKNCMTWLNVEDRLPIQRCELVNAD